MNITRHKWHLWLRAGFFYRIDLTTIQGSMFFNRRLISHINHSVSSTPFFHRTRQRRLGRQNDVGLGFNRSELTFVTLPWVLLGARARVLSRIYHIYALPVLNYNSFSSIYLLLFMVFSFLLWTSVVLVRLIKLVQTILFTVFFFFMNICVRITIFCSCKTKVLVFHIYGNNCNWFFNFIHLSIEPFCIHYHLYS